MATKFQPLAVRLRRAASSHTLCVALARSHCTYAAAARNNNSSPLLSRSCQPTLHHQSHLHTSLPQTLTPRLSRHRPYRSFASITTTDTTKDQFQHAVDHTMDTIQDRLEQSDIEDLGTVDLSYSDGVLNITHNSMTWVMNSHSVTRQIWVSSPVSGPSKYNWHEQNKQWRNERDGKSKLSELISSEWSKQWKVDVDFRDQF